MKKEEIYLSDLERILIGNAPWEFMAEVLIRTLIIYLVLLIVLRLLGKRMSAQLTITELAVMLTLGGIVSVAMQIPERGILPSVLALILVVFFQRSINWLAFKYRKIELITQGESSLLVKDGCMQLEEMQVTRTSREQLFAKLRKRNIQHLGEVKRAYLEGCGTFSVFMYAKPVAGLGILPSKDQNLHGQQPGSSSDYISCQNCGKTIKSRQTACTNCGSRSWAPAMYLIPDTGA